MKTKFFFFILIACLLGIGSCGKNEKFSSLEAQSVNENQAFGELEKQIETLNNRFLIKKTSCQKDFEFAEYKELMQSLTAEGLLEVVPEMPFFPQSWDCEKVDAETRTIAQKNGTLSEAEIVKLAIIASEECAKLPPEVEPDKPVNKEGYMIGNNGYITYRPESCDPIYPIRFSTINLGENVAYQEGINHNRVIQELYLEDNSFLTYKLATKLEKVIIKSVELGLDENNSSNFDLMYNFLEETLPDLRLPITQESYDYLISKYNLGDAGRITALYMLNVSNYSGATALQYTRDFARIVEMSAISEESKYLILAHLSIGINSRFLWNMELPNPMETTLFMAYNGRNSSWSYLSTEELIVSLMSGTAHIWGIPKLNASGQISAIIFYENYADYIPFDQSVFDALLVNNDFYSIMNPIEISNVLTQNDWRIKGAINIPAGNHPVYQMDEYEGIYIITFKHE